MPREAKWAVSFLVGALFLWVGWKIFAFLVFLHVAVCLVLIIVILLQSGEAADLAGAFGGSGSQTAFGPRGAATFLSKSTTWCAVMFMFTSMALAVHARTATGPAGRSILEQFSKPVGKPTAPAPVAPGSIPLGPASGSPAAPAPRPATPGAPSPANQ